MSVESVWKIRGARFAVGDCAQGDEDLASWLGTVQLTSNADARVDCVDVDFAFQIMPRWSMAGGFSYADGRIRDDLIPCNDGNFDGVADTIQPTFADSAAAGRSC